MSIIKFLEKVARDNDRGFGFKQINKISNSIIKSEPTKHWRTVRGSNKPKFQDIIKIEDITGKISNESYRFSKKEINAIKLVCNHFLNNNLPIEIFLDFFEIEELPNYYQHFGIIEFSRWNYPEYRNMIIALVFDDKFRRIFTNQFSNKLDFIGQILDSTNKKFCGRFKEKTYQWFEFMYMPEDFDDYKDLPEYIDLSDIRDERFSLKLSEVGYELNFRKNEKLDIDQIKMIDSTFSKYISGDIKERRLFEILGIKTWPRYYSNHDCGTEEECIIADIMTSELGKIIDYPEMLYWKNITDFVVRNYGKLGIICCYPPGRNGINIQEMTDEDWENRDNPKPKPVEFKVKDSIISRLSSRLTNSKRRELEAETN